jgi:hypothetical protein
MDRGDLVLVRVRPISQYHQLIKLFYATVTDLFSRCYSPFQDRPSIALSQLGYAY